MKKKEESEKRGKRTEREGFGGKGRKMQNAVLIVLDQRQSFANIAFWLLLSKSHL